MKPHPLLYATFAFFAVQPLTAKPNVLLLLVDDLKPTHSNPKTKLRPNLKSWKG
jgi:hypothetical protein